MSPPQNIKLARWYRNDGDIVRRGEVNCELETEKAAVDLEAPNDGILRQLVKVGDIVQAAADIARIEPVSGNQK